MKIQTKQFGEFELDENKVFNFSDGIIGFEELKKFVLIKHEDDLFYWLNSVEEPEIVFPLFPVNALFENYPAEDGHETFGVVKLDSAPDKITINVKAPVYLNNSEKNGFQRIIDDESYPINYNLFKKK